MAREMLNSKKLWIGEIPSHWELKRIKNIIQPSKDGIKIGPFGSALTNKTIGEGEYNVYSQANLIAADFSNTKNTIDSDTFEELISYEVFPGDICLSMMGTIGKCKKVPAGVRRGIMDSHLIKIRLSDSVESRFFEYVYDKDLGGVCFAQMQYDKKGFIMDGLNTSIVKNLYFPLPPIEEQILIADFLDTECSRIDAVIEKTRASIEEYKKLKQAVITRAVTKGIRGNRPMKDSGVEWIGDIPEDWNIVPIIYLTSYNDEVLTESTDPGFSFEYIEIGSVEFGKGIIKTEHLKFADSPSRARRIVCENDIIVSTVRTYLKAVAPIPYSETPLIASTGFVVIRPKNINPVFLRYAILSSSIISMIEANSVGISYPAINASQVVQFKIPVPSNEEQHQISEYLEDKCRGIDRLMDVKKGLLSELETYKKSLIYEYVTGKKEVPAS